MPKTTRAQYEKTRRDNETEARDELESLIPAQYFSQQVAENGLYNKSTKVLFAAIAFLEAGGGLVGGSSQDAQQMIPITSTSNESPRLDPQIEELHSSIGALLDIMSEALNRGCSAESTKLVQQAIELCDDMTEVIRREGWSPEQKKKWQQQQAEWAKSPFE